MDDDEEEEGREPLSLNAEGIPCLILMCQFQIIVLLDLLTYCCHNMLI